MPPLVNSLDWLQLCDYVRNCSENEALDLLQQERARAEPRTEYLRRIHGRVNKLRAERERREINGEDE